ncbi:MAG: undecaprenyl-phosphate glucose phosphotransferase [Pseudomonadales bacterium]|nr:undecaprenyl-phosphate glucose phosphotransferase [Pseudomonadales bacterium]
MYTQGFLKEHSGFLVWVMRLLDWLILLLSCGAAYLYVFGLQPLAMHYQVAILTAVLLCGLVFPMYSLYRTWRGIERMQEIAAILGGWTTVFGILIFLSFISKTSSEFSRVWLTIWYFLGFISIVLTRISLRSVLRYMRGLGFNQRHITIIGSGDVGERVFQHLSAASETGFNVKGYFSDQRIDARSLSSLYQAGIEEAAAYVEVHDIDQVWIAMPLREEERIEQVVNQFSHSTVDIRFVPDIFGFRLINHSISSIAGLSVVNLSVTPMDGINRVVKSIEDKLISFFILLWISPLLLALALAVKVSSRGPVFYKQERLSWNGRKFKMYKFRSMPVDSESESGAVWASKSENRATRVGAFLRRTSLDELPQFINVLRGEMSIVGPRPERPMFVEKFKDEIPGYMQKHMVKAGITGWAQVNGWRGDTDLQMRIEHDLYYIDNWSLWLDLKIIFLTVFKGFVHKNAY